MAGAVLDIFSNLYTDLPIEKPRVPEEDSLVLRLERQVRLVERQVREMQAELANKERVIRELDQAARERLELINRLVETRPADDPTPV